MATQRLDGERHVTESIVSVLAEAGVEFVFGMPGGNTGPLFSALFGHPTIRTILVREESIGSAMAEAYGRLTGRPAVVMGQASADRPPERPDYGACPVHSGNNHSGFSGRLEGR